jgi:hypothetical protein
MLTIEHRISLHRRALRLSLLFFLDPRKEAAEGEELWYMDPLRLSLRHAQHVQGVP